MGSVIDVSSARSAIDKQDYASIATLHPTGATAGFHPITVTPDGVLFGRLDGPNPKLQVDQTPALFDPRTSKLTRIPWPADHPAPKGLILYASATQQWIVWTIAVEHDLDQTPWQLFSYDRKSQVTHFLGAATPTANGTFPTAPGYSRPFLAENHDVYIAAVVQGRPGRPPVDVVEQVPVDGSAPLKTAISNAITPSAWGNDLVWATLSKRHLQFWHRDLITGAATKLYDGTGTDCNSEFGLATAGHRTAWLLQCAHHGGDILQVATPGKPTLSIRGNDLGYLELTTGYVAVAPELISGGYSQVVYNFATDQLLTVGHGSVLGDTPGNGSILTWGSARVGHPAVTTHVIRLRRET